MTSFRYRASVAALPLLLALSSPSWAQSDQPSSDQPAAEGEAQAGVAPGPASTAQIDQVVAPIALYPDQLLTQVLMGSTFPDQLVEANKWLQEPDNAALKGNDLVEALQALNWDPSVKSLVAFPQVVAMLAGNLDWTESLGNDFADQQDVVFGRIQTLRGLSKDAGVLRSTQQVAVREDGSDIIIEDVDPNQVFVPVYNPAEAYGDWPDEDAPPVFIPPPPGFFDGDFDVGIGYGPPFIIIGPLWGWGYPDWRHREVRIDEGRYDRIGGGGEHRGATVSGGEWRHAGGVATVTGGERPTGTASGGQRPPGTIAPGEIHRPPPTSSAGVYPPATGSGGAPGFHVPGEPAHPVGPQPGFGGQPAAPRPGQPGFGGQPEAPHPGQPGFGGQPAGPHPGQPGVGGQPESPHPGQPGFGGQPGPHPVAPTHPVGPQPGLHPPGVGGQPAAPPAAPRPVEPPHGGAPAAPPPHATAPAAPPPPPPRAPTPPPPPPVVHAPPPVVHAPPPVVHPAPRPPPPPPPHR